jgi:hypothetical protein
MMKYPPKGVVSGVEFADPYGIIEIKSINKIPLATDQLRRLP